MSYYIECTNCFYKYNTNIRHLQFWERRKSWQRKSGLTIWWRKHYAENQPLRLRYSCPPVPSLGNFAGMKVYSIISQCPFFVAPTWRILPVFFSLSNCFLMPSGVMPITSASCSLVVKGCLRISSIIRSAVVIRVLEELSWVLNAFSWVLLSLFHEVPVRWRGSCA